MRLRGIGSLALLCLPSGALAQTVLYDLSVTDSQQTLGACGDVDGDGLPDILVGHLDDDTLASNGGAVRVRSGADGSLLHEVFGPKYAGYIGTALDGAGDVDADGFADFVAGGPGIALVWSGADGSLIYQLSGDDPYDRYGVAVAGVGDADLDGFDDFAVGAPFGYAGHPGEGYVRVHSGASSEALTDIPGDCSFCEFGETIAGLGDVDGDALPDLAVYEYDSRKLKLYACTGALEQTLPAGDSSYSIGNQAVASAGDADGDGLLDVVAGEPSSETGGFKVFTALSAEPWLEVNAEPGIGNFGLAVAGVGDWNGDGRDDVAAGAPEGFYVDLYSALDGAQLTRIETPDGGAFGSGLAALGDLNGDGYVELGGVGYGAGAWVHSSCPGFLGTYGVGCKGSNGFVPKLVATGCPNPGQVIVLHVSGGFGGQPVFIAFGQGATEIEIGSAGGYGLSVCNLLVIPAFVLPAGMLSGFGPGLGELEVHIAIPPGTSGASVFAQAAGIDPFTPNGFAVSNGIRVDVE